MKTLLRLIPIFIILFGCSPKNPIDRSVPVIRFEAAKFIDMSELFDSVRFLQLENHPEGVILDIDRVETHHGRIFLLDKRLKSVVCFDTDGKFLFRIQNTGTGYGEYRDLDAMWINCETEELQVQCFNPKKIIRFGLDGRVRSEVPISWGMQDMLPLSNGNLVGFSSHGGADENQSIDPGLFILSPKGEVIEQPLVFGGRSVYWSINYQRHLADYKEGALVLSQSDTLWKVDGAGVVTADLVMNWGVHSLPGRMRVKRLQAGEPTEYLKGNYVLGKDMLVAFGPIRLFRIFLNKTEQFAMIDLRSGKGHYSSQVISPRNSIPLLFPIGKSDDNEVIGFMNANSVSSLAGIMQEEPGCPDWIKKIDKSKNLLWFGKIKNQLLNY